MKIAILSDTHDQIDNTTKAMEQIAKLGADALLFCGDFVAPGPAKIIAGFNGPVYVVFGNNDGDKMNIARLMNGANSSVTFFAEADGVFELGGRKIAMTHYPLYAQALARTGDYDLVAFGHDHNARIETHGTCLAVNPGCMNMVRPGNTISFSIYDTDAHAATLYDLNGGILAS